VLWPHDIEKKLLWWVVVHLSSTVMLLSWSTSYSTWSLVSTATGWPSKYVAIRLSQLRQTKAVLCLNTWNFLKPVTFKYKDL